MRFQIKLVSAFSAINALARGAAVRSTGVIHAKRQYTAPPHVGVILDERIKEMAYWTKVDDHSAKQYIVTWNTTNAPTNQTMFSENPYSSNPGGTAGIDYVTIPPANQTSGSVSYLNLGECVGGLSS
jgi:hypothetical protein